MLISDFPQSPLHCASFVEFLPYALNGIRDEVP